MRTSILVLMVALALCAVIVMISSPPPAAASPLPVSAVSKTLLVLDTPLTVPNLSHTDLARLAPSPQEEAPEIPLGRYAQSLSAWEAEGTREGTCKVLRARTVCQWAALATARSQAAIERASTLTPGSEEEADAIRHIEGLEMYWRRPIKDCAGMPARRLVDTLDDVRTARILGDILTVQRLIVVGHLFSDDDLLAFAEQLSEEAGHESAFVDTMVDQAFWSAIDIVAVPKGDIQMVLSAIDVASGRSMLLGQVATKPNAASALELAEYIKVVYGAQAQFLPEVQFAERMGQQLSKAEEAQARAKGQRWAADLRGKPLFSTVHQTRPPEVEACDDPKTFVNW